MTDPCSEPLNLLCSIDLPLSGCLLPGLRHLPAVDVPRQGGLAAAEVPGSCGVGAVQRDAAQAGQVLPSSGGSRSVGELILSA